MDTNRDNRSLLGSDRARSRGAGHSRSSPLWQPAAEKKRRTMARQKSERRIEPQASRKAGETRGDERRGGGKATPVYEQTRQLGMFFGTAEECETKVERADGGADAGRPAPGPSAEPKPRDNEEKSPSETMEQVCSVVSLQTCSAYQRPRAASAGSGISRGREPAGGWEERIELPQNPPSRRAGREQHLSGSVGLGAGNRPWLPDRAQPRTAPFDSLRSLRTNGNEGMPQEYAPNGQLHVGTRCTNRCHL